MNRKGGESLTDKDREIKKKMFCLYRLPYDDTSKTKEKPVTDRGRFNIASSVQENGEADLLKGFDSLNMEENFKLLKHRKINYLLQIGKTPQRHNLLFLVVDNPLYTNKTK